MSNGRQLIVLYVLSLYCAASFVHGEADVKADDKKQNVCTTEDMLKLKLSISELQSKSSSLETDVCRLKNDVMLEKLRENANSTVDQTKTVAFYVAQRSTLNPTEHGTDLKFDTLITNEGGAYNFETGRFTAPSNGIYAFTLIVSSVTGHQAAADFIVSGRAMGTAWSDCRRSWVTATNRIIVSLLENEQVWIISRKHGDLRNRFYGSSHYTNFSGMKVN